MNQIAAVGDVDNVRAQLHVRRQSVWRTLLGAAHVASRYNYVPEHDTLPAACWIAYNPTLCHPCDITVHPEVMMVTNSSAAMYISLIV